MNSFRSHDNNPYSLRPCFQNAKPKTLLLCQISEHCNLTVRKFQVGKNKKYFKRFKEFFWTFI